MRRCTSGAMSSSMLCPRPMPRMRKAPCAKSRKLMSLPSVRAARAPRGCGTSMPVYSDSAHGVRLVEEGEALRSVEAALLELHHHGALAQQDHLPVLVVEVDAARHVR
eukprot:scaffold14728_cov48-Phaeocystis_antarctica.AAC.3